MLEERYHKEKIPLAPAFGTEYPERFTSPADEYHALVRSCGVIDITHRRVFRVRGAGRARFLDAVVTNDVASLSPGHGCHALMTTPEGRIVSELFVFARGGDHIVVVSQGDSGETVRVLREESGGRDATADDVSAAYGVLAVEGPEAGRVMDRLFGKGQLPASALRAVEREFEKFSILVMRASATGEDGFHVMVPAAEVLRIRDYLVQAARGSDGLPAGLAAWNVRRVEAGLPWYGIDFTREDYPDDVRLGAAVCETKGPFRGKQALARPDARGSRGHALVGLVVEDEGYAEKAVGGDLDLRGPVSGGSPIHARHSLAAEKERPSPEPAGFVTSSVKSPALGRPLFMASVRRELLGGDRGYSVDTPHGALSLRAIELPLHKTGF